MLFLSESDAPFEVVHWKNLTAFAPERSKTPDTHPRCRA
ncbi:nuclease A inhibitor family protein [Kamptonema formosum]|nr:nuclease A inhibitor family protein [Kamptonema formosum]